MFYEFVTYFIVFSLGFISGYKTKKNNVKPPNDNYFI